MHTKRLYSKYSRVNHSLSSSVRSWRLRVPENFSFELICRESGPVRLHIAWVRGGQSMALHVTFVPVSMVRLIVFPTRHKVTAQGSPFLAGPSRTPRKTSLEFSLMLSTLTDLHTAWKSPSYCISCRLHPWQDNEPYHGQGCCHTCPVTRIQHS